MENYFLRSKFSFLTSLSLSLIPFFASKKRKNLLTTISLYLTEISVRFVTFSIVVDR